MRAWGWIGAGAGAGGNRASKPGRSRWLQARALGWLWAPLLTAGPALAAPVLAAPNDGLGLWLTTVDSQVLYQPQQAREAVQFLAANGFRRAAVPLYTGGYTTWSLAPKDSPLDIPSDPQLPSPSSTRELLDALGHEGLERVGWLEFGLMAPANAPWLSGRQALLLQDAQGSTLWPESPGLNRVWLNPALPEVRQALVSLAVKACTQLPLEALQLDDHLGYPARFGYDPATLALWRQTAAGASDPMPAADDPQWTAWRADLITALLVEIRAAMASACPGVRLSVAPNPQDFSYSNYLADWSRWIREGLVDEVVVQIYRRDPDRVAWELAQPSLAAARGRVPIRIGLLAGLKNQPKDPATLQRELAVARRMGFAGIDLFFYESARQHFPSSPQPPTP